MLNRPQGSALAEKMSAEIIVEFLKVLFYKNVRSSPDGFEKQV